MLLSELKITLKRLVEEYEPVAIVADVGSNKQTIESLNHELQDEGIFIEAAEKHDKNTHVKILADYARRGDLEVAPGSQLAEECSLLEWAYSPTTGQKTFPENVRKLGRHFDFFHSTLYLFRKVQPMLPQHFDEGKQKRIAIEDQIPEPNHVPHREDMFGSAPDWSQFGW